MSDEDAYRNFEGYFSKKNAKYIKKQSVDTTDRLCQIYAIAPAAIPATIETASSRASALF